MTFTNVQLNQHSNQIVIDNVPYDVNEDLEFEYNNQTYVVYLNTLPLRKHNGYKVSDVYTETFSVVRRDVAVELAQCFANLVPIADIGLPVTKSCKAALEDVITYLNSMIVSSNDPNNAMERDTYAKIQSLMQTVVGVMSKLSDQQLVSYLTYGNVQTLRLINPNEKFTVSHCITAMRRYIIFAITFKEEILNHRSFSLMFDVFLNIIGTVLLLHSHTFVEYKSVQDLIVHEIGITVESLIYDRCSKVLFIEGGSQVATGIYNELKVKYPELRTIHTEHDLAKAKRFESVFAEENNKYNINLFPYMLFYNMPDNVRIKQNLRCVHEMRKNMNDQQVESFERFYSFVKQCYENLIEPLDNKPYSTYTTDSLQSIFTHSIFMQMNAPTV